MLQRRSPGVRRLAQDARGSAITEFALISPVFLTLLFGIYDIGQTVYAQSVLQGALQDAGRDAGLESGPQQVAVIDAYVKKQVGPIVFGNPKYTIKRANYKTFSDVARPEDFEDKDPKNGKYDDNECFWDENGTNTWENDVGKDGIGGANDVSVYTATVEYDRVFPLWKLIGLSNKNRLSSTTVLRNQPFGPQAGRAKKRICPGTPV